MIEGMLWSRPIPAFAGTCYSRAARLSVLFICACNLNHDDMMALATWLLEPTTGPPPIWYIYYCQLAKSDGDLHASKFE